MAHFAEIDQNNRVLRVLVVDNRNTSDAQGFEKEHIGAAFLESILSGTWKQTSYNANFRKNYAGIDYTFDQQRDAFIPPKPYASWVLIEETCQWTAPVTMPTDGKKYVWDENLVNWVEVV